MRDRERIWTIVCRLLENAHIHARRPDGDTVFTIRTARASRELEVTFPIEPIAAIMEDRSGLGTSGEVFLVDPGGRFLTEPRDEYLRTRLGQTVELLRGDVLLPNYERVAGLKKRYDPTNFLASNQNIT